jgi:hypothetical protein
MTMSKDDLCPYCNKSLFGVNKTLTWNIADQTVHAECEFAMFEELEKIRRKH